MLRDEVYVNNPHTIEELKENIQKMIFQEVFLSISKYVEILSLPTSRGTPF
jgi:hypothetical protein